MQPDIRKTSRHQQAEGGKRHGKFQLVGSWLTFLFSFHALFEVYLS